MIYKKEIKEKFILYEDSDIQHIHIFINGKYDSSIINLPKQKLNFTFHIPEYEHLQKMLFQNIDVKIE